MDNLQSLEPGIVWRHFARICGIPHVSGREQALGEYLLSAAEELGLKARRRGSGNVFVVCPASPGYENRPPVLLQAHMDMVGVKSAGGAFDFAKDPVAPRVTPDGFVTASGTTLGADDGVGMAMILAVLSDRTLAHPEIHALFTAEEETGMAGARALGPEDVAAPRAINLDSETLGEICVGCAGGSAFTVSLEPDVAEVRPEDYGAIEIIMSNGLGGHSGIDIARNRVNAATAVLRLVDHLTDAGIDAGISEIRAGTVRNSIPSEAVAVIAVPAAQAGKAVQSLHDIAGRLQTKYVKTDPNVSFLFRRPDALPDFMTTAESTRRIVALRKLNVRVAEYLEDGVTPLTSCNLGAVALENNSCRFELLARYATAAGRDLIEGRIRDIAAEYGAEAVRGDVYSFWEPDYASPLLKTAAEEYKRIAGADPRVTVIHAGLECGLLKALKPDLDVISLGPDIFGAHSVKERVGIASVATCYRWLTAVLARL